jgi:hypothetical protein
MFKKKLYILSTFKLLSTLCKHSLCNEFPVKHEETDSHNFGIDPPEPNSIEPYQAVSEMKHADGQTFVLFNFTNFVRGTNKTI